MSHTTLHSSPWILGRREDLVWLSGACLLSVAAVFAFRGLELALAPEVALVALYVCWALLFDGTHFFATYSRTLLDPAFRRDQRSLLLASAAVFVAGPALLALAFFAGGEEATRAMSFALNRFAITWAYYHLCRQHFGIVALYRRKQGDVDPISRRLDALVMGAGFALPYVHALIHLGEPLSAAELEWIGEVGWQMASGVLVLVGGIAAAGAGWLRLGVRGGSVSAPALALWPLAWVSLGIGLALPVGASLGWFFLLEHAYRALAVAFGLGLAASLVYALRSRSRIHWPKWTMLFAALATHFWVLSTPGVPIVLAMLALTLGHNVQYHRIVRFHNVNHYGGPGERHFARRATDSLRLFWIAALGFSAVLLATKGLLVTLGDHEIAAYLFAALLWGVPLHHYVLDASIWRPSRSEQLRKTLGVEPSAMDRQAPLPTSG